MSGRVGQLTKLSQQMQRMGLQFLLTLRQGPACKSTTSTVSALRCIIHVYDDRDADGSDETQMLIKTICSGNEPSMMKRGHGLMDH
jgi:hypothetical protein